MKLPVINVLSDSLTYMVENYKIAASFAMINFVLLLVSSILGGWTNLSFLFSLSLIYVLWVAYFRLYFQKKPLIDYKSVTHSLMPSTKILLFMFLFGIILVFLPYIFIYLGLPIDFMEQYIDDSYLLNLVLIFLFLLVSPNVLYRPYFAWIGSVVDRNKSIRFAFNHTKGNYFRFLFILIFINALMFFVHSVCPFEWIELLFVSVIFTYFNIVLAKSYEFFFVNGVQ